MVRIGSRLPGEGDAEAAWVAEIAMTALAPAIDETGAFEVGDQFPEFSGHGSIKTILLQSASDLYDAAWSGFDGLTVNSETAAARRAAVMVALVVDALQVSDRFRALRHRLRPRLLLALVLRRIYPQSGLSIDIEL